jgi:hypothetical protein
MATLLKVLNNLADIRSAGGVALRVRTQGFYRHVSFETVLGLAASRGPETYRDIVNRGTQRFGTIYYL